MKRISWFLIGIVYFSFICNGVSLRTTFALVGQGVEVNPYTVNQPTEIKVYFEVGKTVRVHDWISFLFSPGFQYTEPEQKPKVPCETCLGKPIIRFYNDGSILFKFNSHIELDPSKEGYRYITVTIPKDNGFSTPILPGSYEVKVATQAEPEWVLAGVVEILTNEMPDGLLITEYGQKGKGDWFISSPVIDIQTLAPNSSLWYYQNHHASNINKKKLSALFYFGSGQHIIDYHYCLENQGKLSEWRIFTVCIDTEPPKFEIPQANENVIVTNQSTYNLLGFFYDDIMNDREVKRSYLDRTEFRIDQQIIPINLLNNTFETTLSLQLGENIIRLEATDQAGNTTEKTITILRNKE